MSSIIDGGVTGALKIVQGEVLAPETSDDGTEATPSENVLNAELLPDTIAEFERSSVLEFARIGHNFKDYEQFELFHMLPLSKKQKAEILARSIELSTA